MGIKPESEDWLDSDRDTAVDGAPDPRAGPRQVHAWLTLLTAPSPGQIFALQEPAVTIGRGNDAGLRLAIDSLSRHHARVLCEADAFFIEDLKSSNGTFVNGRQVVEKKSLNDGDRVELGPATVFRFTREDEAQRQAVVEVYNNGVRDLLTGIYNWQYFEDRLIGEFSFAKRQQTTLSVLMTEVDNLDGLIDRHGPTFGEAVLGVVGSTFLRITRKEDVVARHGTREFVVLARALSSRNAGILGERLRHAASALKLPAGDEEISVSVSVGVATHSDHRVFGSAAALLAAADAALYAARKSGRNRVIGD
jgi:two-component system, cell cycle response regulator